MLTRGPGDSSGKALGYGLYDLDSIPGGGAVEIFFIPSCSDWPGVKTAERRTKHPTSS